MFSDTKDFFQTDGLINTAYIKLQLNERSPEAFQGKLKDYYEKSLSQLKDQIHLELGTNFLIKVLSIVGASFAHL